MKIGQFTLSSPEPTDVNVNDYVDEDFYGDIRGQTLKSNPVYQITRKKSTNPGDKDYYYRKISSRNEPKYVKGTTSYGTVTSTSPTAHETGKRNSDGYWYVSVSPQ